MSINPLLLPIKKDAETIRTTILTNIVKMLTYRKWLNSEDNETNLSSLSNDDTIYKIKLNTDFNKEEDNKDNDIEPMLVIKILQQNITGVNKSPQLTEFLTQYKKFHKIIIVERISDKAKMQLDKIPHTEVFVESFFMINLTEHACSPQYEILTPEQTNEFLTAYQVTKRKLPKMDVNDPASLYLYLKKGQIVRIIRDSEITGKSIGYRVIINKGANKI